MDDDLVPHVPIRRAPSQESQVTLGPMTLGTKVKRLLSLSAQQPFLQESRFWGCVRRASLEAIMHSGVISVLGLRCLLHTAGHMHGAWSLNAIVTLALFGCAAVCMPFLGLLANGCLPALPVSTLHGALVWMQFRLYRDLGWSSAAAWDVVGQQGAMLQTAAAGISVGSHWTWTVSTALLLVALLAAGAEEADVTPMELFGSMLPLLVPASLSALQGLTTKSSPAGGFRPWLREFLRQLLVGHQVKREPPELKVLQLALQPILQPAEERHADIAERLQATLKELTASNGLQPWLMDTLQQVCQALLQQLPTRQLAVYGSELNQAPPMVREFVLQNIVGEGRQQGAAMRSDGPNSASGRSRSRKGSRIGSPSRNSPDRSSSRRSGGSKGQEPPIDVFQLQLRGAMHFLGHKEQEDVMEWGSSRRSGDRPIEPSHSAIHEIPPPEDDTSSLLFNVGRWDLNLFEVAERTRKPLSLVGKAAYERVADDLNLPSFMLREFLVSIEIRYRRDNPYHNSLHAADVVNSLVYFLRLRTARGISSLEPLDRLAAIVAGVGHDVGHDGFTNRYHTVAGTSLALLYNDQSCLENMHAAITFMALQSPLCNFMKEFTDDEEDNFRKTVIQMILDTDLVKHKITVDRFQEEFLADPPEQLSLSQRHQLLSLLLKAADVGGSGKPFRLHSIWAMRINTEFFRQGDFEQEAGLRCSPFCDRKGTNVAQSQTGFFQFIAIPLYSVLNEYLKSRRVNAEIWAEMRQNSDFWKILKDEGFDYETPDNNLHMLATAFESFQRVGPPELVIDPGQPPISGTLKNLPGSVDE